MSTPRPSRYSDYRLARQSPHPLLWPSAPCLSSQAESRATGSGFHRSCPPPLLSGLTAVGSTTCDRILYNKQDSTPHSKTRGAHSAKVASLERSRTRSFQRRVARRLHCSTLTTAVEKTSFEIRPSGRVILFHVTRIFAIGSVAVTTGVHST